MEPLSYEYLEKMPIDFIAFYIKVIAKLRISETEYNGMKLKYPDYFDKIQITSISKSKETTCEKAELKKDSNTQQTLEI